MNKKILITFILIVVVGSLLVFSATQTPKELQKLNNETVIGIDENKNGIRDDVDLFLSDRYSTNATAKEAAQISAIAHQKILETDYMDKIAARKALEESADA